MKIINPLYDLAFKYLMANERLAKKALSVLLDQEILELSIGQQETLLPDEKRGLTLFRLDFKALIKEADGTSKKVLIELQKSKYNTDIQRFRTYLGANYIAKETKKNTEGNKEIDALYPIITIYILGYNLDDLPYMAVKVNRDIINSVNKEPIKVKSFFIEHLTHQSHIIQLRRLPELRQTRLEQFLSLFNQAWITSDKYILDLQDISEEFQDMAKYLQGPTMDDNFRRQLEAEEELDTIFDEQEAKYLKQIAEAELKEKEAKQKEKEAKQKEKEAKQKGEEERKQKELAQKKEKEAQKREHNLAIKFARQLKKLGFNLKDIAQETGLTLEELEKLFE